MAFAFILVVFGALFLLCSNEPVSIVFSLIILFYDVMKLKQGPMIRQSKALEHLLNPVIF